MKPSPKEPDLIDMLGEISKLPGMDALLNGEDDPDYFDRPSLSPNMLKRDRINLRISAYDKRMLKDIAIAMGMPYQTLAVMVLRYYVQAQIRKK